MKLKDLLNKVSKGVSIAIFDEDGKFVCLTEHGDYTRSVLQDFWRDEVLSIDTMVVDKSENKQESVLLIKTKDTYDND